MVPVQIAPALIAGKPTALEVPFFGLSLQIDKINSGLDCPAAFRSQTCQTNLGPPGGKAETTLILMTSDQRVKIAVSMRRAKIPQKIHNKYSRSRFVGI